MSDTGQWLQIFRNTGALLEGHFVLRSGRHSRQFFQCALVLQYPRHAEAMARALAKKIQQSGYDRNISGVISPALGGVVFGQELARALDAPRHIFAEKEEGRLALRRGFVIEPGTCWIVAEDVITQGGRAGETVAIVRRAGAEVACVATIVLRGEREPDLGCPLLPLVVMSVETFDPEDVPEDLKNIPAVKPGSV